MATSSDRSSRGTAGSSSNFDRMIGVLAGLTAGFALVLFSWIPSHSILSFLVEVECGLLSLFARPI